MRHFGDLMFTDTVKAEQERLGSRDAYARMTEQPAPEGLGLREAEFIQARDSFYMATVNEDGWPYIQHRGGPAGFLKLLSPTQLGFADYRGNRQYVSTGNLLKNACTSLFLMDYPNRQRLKLLARTTVQPAEENEALAEKLSLPGQGKVERLFTLDLEAFDWNCPQFITPRFTREEVEIAMSPVYTELESLKQHQGT